MDNMEDPAARCRAAMIEQLREAAASLLAGDLADRLDEVEVDGDSIRLPIGMTLDDPTAAALVQALRALEACPDAAMARVARRLASEEPEVQPARRTLCPEARARIAEGQRKRWDGIRQMMEGAEKKD